MALLCGKWCGRCDRLGAGGKCGRCDLWGSGREAGVVDVTDGVVKRRGYCVRKVSFEKKLCLLLRTGTNCGTIYNVSVCAVIQLWDTDTRNVKNPMKRTVTYNDELRNL